jgi:rRNA maturation protein Nop10
MKMYCMTSGCDFEYEDHPTNAPLQFCPKCGGSAFGNQIVTCPHCGKRTGVAFMYPDTIPTSFPPQQNLRTFEVKL